MSRKLYFSFLLLFCAFSFSQEISGCYCTNPINKTQLVNHCFIFKSDFTFEELSIYDNVWILNGTFEIKKKLLILQYDDPLLKNIKYKFRIIKNKNNNLIIKDLTTKVKYILQKTTDIQITFFPKTHKSL